MLILNLFRNRTLTSLLVFSKKPCLYLGKHDEVCFYHSYCLTSLTLLNLISPIDISYNFSKKYLTSILTARLKVNITPTITKEEQSLSTKFAIFSLRGTNIALQNRQHLIACIYLHLCNFLNEKFINYERSFLFLLSFIIVHQGIFITDISKWYIDFLLKEQ